jgi:hypothetical protein
MIDTDKYEGHTPMWYLNTIGVDGITGQWRIESDFTTHDGRVVAILRSENEADAQLMADAPDLLIEVKRLNNIISRFDEFMCKIPQRYTEGTMGLWNELLTKEEEE